MQQRYASGNSCCFPDRPASIDPTTQADTVRAGAVTSGCGYEVEAEGCKLATVYFPDQTYRAGYCPCKALKCGTLFPELVSPYPTGCGCAEVEHGTM